MDAMLTFQITLSEPLQQFVLDEVAELGLDRPDQYIEQLLEEVQSRKFDNYCMEKVQEAIDQNEWIAEKEFWKLVDEDTQTRRKARQAEAIS
jgi:methionyl-tRNA synthetase